MDTETGWRERVAEALRGMGPIGALTFFAIIAIASFAPPADFHTIIGALLVLLWARLSRTPLADIGLVRPNSWLGVLAIGIALGAAEKFLMKSIVLPVLGAPAVAHAYHLDIKRLVVGIVLSILSAGICEELVFRGYTYERLGKWFGDSVRGRAAIVVLTSILFGLLHAFLGVYGVMNAAILGALNGAIYFLNRKRLWTLIVAHATFDVLSFVIAYMGLESAMSHLVFR